MRQLPVPDPGEPDIRSAGRYVRWLVREHAGTIALGILHGCVWMVCLALLPYAIGHAIDAGVAARDSGALLTWTAVLLVVAATGAVAGILRHRCAVQNWLGAAYRTIQIVSRHTTRLGATLPKRVATGEVVAIGTADIAHIGNVLDITARGTGAVVSIAVVAALLLGTSVPLGLVVLVGVPVLVVAIGPLLKPLHRRQQDYRERQGKLTGRANDIVAGLRVLRGVGGEEEFGARYAAESQRVRRAGVRVARVESVLDAAQVLLPGVFVVLVVWLGARFALAGRISVGDLVAFYGYTSFLVMPMRTLTEAADKVTKGLVAARRVVRVLALVPEIRDPDRPAAAPAGAELVDAESGLVVAPGLVTAVATAEPADALAIADRLGRYADGPVTLGGVRLADLPVADVRRRVLVADNDARLFTGVLRTGLDPSCTAAPDRIEAALAAASAEDIVAALPEGLDAPVTERGRSFSGGQQQRLRLARALLADPEILVLVEPTSAVDAHTEARIAAGLTEARAGRTTVVATTSPLVLDRVDRVAYVEHGRVIATGTHRDLLDTHPRYAATVTREEDS